MVNIGTKTQDVDFCEYASARMNHVLRSCNHPANAYDREYERIYKETIADTRYVTVYVPYMTFKLNKALLIKNRRKRKTMIWWIWKKLVFDYTFLTGMQGCEDSLSNRTYDAVLDMLYNEYKHKKPKVVC